MSMFHSIIYCFYSSETFTSNGESRISLRKLKKCLELAFITEKTFKEHLYQRNNSDHHPYIDTIVQKLYHSTKEGFETNETLSVDIVFH